MDEVVGKGQRVAGFFLWMVGAGVILDTDAIAIGSGLIAVGTALFGWGVVLGRRAAEALAPYRAEPRR